MSGWINVSLSLVCLINDAFASVFIRSGDLWLSVRVSWQLSVIISSNKSKVLTEEHYCLSSFIVNSLWIYSSGSQVRLKPATETDLRWTLCGQQSWIRSESNKTESMWRATNSWNNMVLGVLASLTTAHAFKSLESVDITPPSGSCSSEKSWSIQIKVQEASQSSPGRMILKWNHVFPIIFPCQAVQLLLRYCITCQHTIIEVLIEIARWFWRLWSRSFSHTSPGWALFGLTC